MKFHSKMDLWLAVVVWGAIAACIVPLFFEFDWVILVVAVGMAVLVGTMWFGTYYIIEDGVLIINGGFSRKRIDIVQITKLTKTSNPLSAPALSLKRIEVLYNPGMQMMLVSPKEQQRFIEALLAQNAQIEVDDRLL